MPQPTTGFEQQLATARAGLTYAFSQADLAANALHPRVETHALRFTEDKHRWRVIRDAGAGVVAELASFRRIYGQMPMRLLLKTMEAEIAVVSEGERKIEQILASSPGKREVAPGDRFTDAAAIFWQPIIDIYNTASTLILLHEATLRTFLRKHVDRSPEVVIEAMIETFRDESRERLLDAIQVLIERTAEELIPVFKVAKLWANIRDEILDLHKPYDGAGPADRIGMLWDSLIEQNRILALASEAIDA